MGNAFHRTSSNTTVSVVTGEPILTATVAQDIANAELASIGRGRVYPRTPSTNVVLTTGAGANQYGNWTEIIPINTVPFDFVVLGVIVEAVSATGTYHVQVGWTAGSTGDPAANDIVGEVRFRATAPLANSIQRLVLAARPITGNYRCVGRIQNDSGGDNITISVNLRRYLKLSQSTTPYPSFPW